MRYIFLVYVLLPLYRVFDRENNNMSTNYISVPNISVSSRTESVDDGKSKSEFISELIKLKLHTLQTLRSNLCTILCNV
jgi:hypothetical protein